MVDQGVEDWAKGARLGKPGLTDIVGERLLLLAKGDCVDLSSRVNLHGHLMSAILHGKLEPGVE